MKENTKINIKSRRETPWTGVNDATPTQLFIEKRTEAEYNSKHPSAGSNGEAEFLNSLVPSGCPFCDGTDYKKAGKTAAGIQRFQCKKCQKTFTITTGTIFDDRKIPVTEWIGFLLDLFGYSSLSLASKGNRNSFNTTKYWLRKVFLTLEGIQDDIILSGKVYLDETYYKVRKGDVQLKADGKEYRGISRNQICIGIATDGTNTMCLVEGTGKPGKKRTYDLFGRHINTGSLLIHDGEGAHDLLVEKLELISEVHPTAETKGLPDDKNPLCEVNRMCALLKKFLGSHPGFTRDDLQGYLNLFCFISNPPCDKYEKIEKLLDLTFRNPKMLRYRG